jgi:hypothetical protein
VLAGSQPIQMFFDPETGDEYPQPGFPSAAVVPDGTVYVASEHDSPVSPGAITVARSRDGGRTWSSSGHAECAKADVWMPGHPELT